MTTYTLRAFSLAIACSCQTLIAGTLGNLTYETNADSVTITEFGWDHYGPIEVPAMIEGKPVTAIADNACEHREGITTVTLPASVIRIGKSAFEGCWDLRTMNIPGDGVKIGENAFKYCQNLREVTLPPTICHFGKSAFESCEQLRKISLPPGLTKISPFLFHRCVRLRDCGIPNGVTTIGESAFSSTALQDAIIPHSVVTMGNSVFSGCSKLENVRLPRKITKIPDGLFSYCGALTEINLPPSTRKIGVSAFEATSLSELRLKGVVSIGDMAFAHCGRLTSVEIPKSVKSIGVLSFAHCVRLTGARFLGNAPGMGNRAFVRAADDFRIFVEESSRGFTAPRWLGYRLSRAKAEIVIQNEAGELTQNGAGPTKFGSILVGKRSRSQTFVITNVGNRPLTGIRARFKGQGFLDFPILQAPSITLDSGKNTTIKVAFEPLLRGRRTVTLELLSSDSDEGTFALPLSGIGIVQL